jgi:hypothetical protein
MGSVLERCRLYSTNATQAAALASVRAIDHLLAAEMAFIDEQDTMRALKRCEQVPSRLADSERLRLASGRWAKPDRSNKP